MSALHSRLCLRKKQQRGVLTTVHVSYECTCRANTVCSETNTADVKNSQRLYKNGFLFYICCMYVWKRTPSVELDTDVYAGSQKGTEIFKYLLLPFPHTFLRRIDKCCSVLYLYKAMPKRVISSLQYCTTDLLQTHTCIHAYLELCLVFLLC